MHDIGKIAIPDSVLLKPGKLTPEEFEIMKTHTIRGCEILQSLDYTQDEEYYNYCYDICRHHHERWDGNGYPDHLVGEQISIPAQVVSLADVYEALISERVYKPAYTHEEAIQMIAGGECGIFNPQLLKDVYKRQVLILCVKDLLEDIFKGVVVFFGYGIFGGKPQILTGVQREVKAASGKAFYRSSGVVHALDNPRSRKIMYQLSGLFS